VIIAAAVLHENFNCLRYVIFFRSAYYFMNVLLFCVNGIRHNYCARFSFVRLIKRTNARLECCSIADIRGRAIRRELTF